MNTTPLIELKNVVFVHDDHPILHDISFTVEQGNFATIMGGSGSGKTMLVRLITGQTHPQQGQVLIKGRDVARFPDTELYERRRHMGVLFQYGTLLTGPSMYDNIAFPVRELTGLPEGIIRDLVVLKLNAVGLRGVERLMPSELSGDVSRRIVLACTIVLDPETIFYDEPFTGLDLILLGVIAHLTSRVDKTLRSTNIMVMHDIGKSLEIVNQVVSLMHGEVMFSDSPQEMRKPNLPRVRQFIDDLANGPVAFRYPTQMTLRQDLIG